jgi:CheY-like chemotaxis protein/nitrogen-specific signal transduction histidine kinase
MASTIEQAAPLVAKILLVDDRPANLRALEAVLATRGFQLVCAASGRDALRELLRADFALVILDVQMPELDGFETATLMRKRERNAATPIIFLTALYTEPTHAAHGYAVGAVDYICKPFDPSTLLAKVQVFADLYLCNARLRLQAELLAAKDRELLEARGIADAHRQGTEMAGVKAAFLASISHELRTPMHSLIGWAHLLRSNLLSEEKRESALDIIERNARQQVKLVDDLIDVAHLVTGTLVLDLQRFDLGALVASEAQAVRSAFPSRRLRLLQDTAELMVHGDPRRLRQTIRHLLANALKFSAPAGRIEVSISGTAGRANVVVSDDGEGIAPEFLPHIFEPFRAEESFEESRGGLAIGLALAKNVALLHGGDLIAASGGKGCGSTFTLELPWVEAAVNLRAAPAPLASAADFDLLLGDRSGGAASAAGGRARFNGALEGARILVVEDEVDARELMCTLLESEGVIVSSAASAEEAMRRFAETRPDILLSDIGLPGEDGCSLMRRVRALGPELGGDVPAVALTAYGSSEDVLHVLGAGFDKHLSKPTGLEQLLGVLISIRRVEATPVDSSRVSKALA